MAARKENVPLIIAIIVIFSAIVGVRAYRDMHPAAADPALDLAQTYSYFADNDASLAKVPDDQSTIFIKVGDFTIDKNDQVTYAADGPKPVNFPQRDTALFFNINHLPQNPAPVFEKISGAMEPWKKVGNIFNAIIVNDEEDKPDLEALASFSNALKLYFHKEHTLILEIKRQHLPSTPAERNQLANVLKTVQYFIFDYDDARIAKEKLFDTLTRLDKEEIPFMLRLKRLPDDFAADRREKLKALKLNHYSGTLLEEVPSSEKKAEDK